MHYSVLLHESIDLLSIKPNGIYIDGTFGRGGHSLAILDKLDANGRLIAFDKDPDAVSFANKNISDQRFMLIHDSFAELKNYLKKLQIESVDGILLDLGVSSPQLDTVERGFSFRNDAVLDMRMNNTCGISAKEWINTASESDIADVLWRYGEERFSRKIAKAIVSKRSDNLITTTTQLAQIISDNVFTKDRTKHPATKSFQAIRIFINNELGDLQKILEDIPNLLNKNGRMVVISFHSLEDRIVKQHFNQLANGEQLPKWIMLQDEISQYKIIAKKIKATDEEINKNIRSRSAVLRTLEKLI